MYNIQAKNAIEQSIILSAWMQKQTETAVLCNETAYADIAVAAGVTRKLHAHFYLSDADRVKEEIIHSMTRAGVRRVILIGGEASLSAAIFHQLRNHFSVQRIGGNRAADTAKEAALWLREETGSETVLVEKSEDPEQRLYAGCAAARIGATVLWDDNLPDEQNWIQIEYPGESSAVNTVYITKEALLLFPATAVFAGVKNAVFTDKSSDARGTVYKIGQCVSVLLDPGHAKGINRYAIRNATEGEVMFHYARELGERLTASGWKVGYTRNRVDENPDLTARGRMGEGYDLLLSLHSNAMPNHQPKIRGTEIYDSLRNPAPVLGNALCSAIAEVFHHPNRGLKYRRQEDGRDWYGILRESRATHSFLIEHGFHTNPVDAAIMIDKQPQIADATVAVLNRWAFGK